MEQMNIPIEYLRDILTQRGLGGYPLLTESIGTVYGILASSHEIPSNLPLVQDWATISYVQTDSAHGRGGMPDWVAADGEVVLDALVQRGILKQKAIWLDQLGMKQCGDWPSLATLQCLVTPVVCVLPTRTLEYSRFQVPRGWDVVTYEFLTKVEDMFRQCSKCKQMCPLEYDSRLISVAAAFRAWPTTEAVIGSSGRGAFISFATLDRLEYTIAWYQVLLQLALDCNGYGPEAHDRCIGLYGEPLFEPCSRCHAVSRSHCADIIGGINCHAVDETLTALLQQANLFSLPWARDSEGRALWTLGGLQRSPGEGYIAGPNNSRRVTPLLHRTILTQPRLDDIAANVVRGRVSLLPCHRPGDKWLCALILCNLGYFCLAIQSPDKSFDEQMRDEISHLLGLEWPFGSLTYRNPILDRGENHCVRCQPCDGKRGSVCFFNELSGMIAPSAVGEFIKDRGFSATQQAEILASAEDSLRWRIHNHGVAYVCHEVKIKSPTEEPLMQCAKCYEPDNDAKLSVKEMVLVGWHAPDEEMSPMSVAFDEQQNGETVYNYMVFDIQETGHVVSRGVFRLPEAPVCFGCGSMHVRARINFGRDILEIHVDEELPIARAVSMIFTALRKSHQPINEMG